MHPAMFFGLIWDSICHDLQVVDSGGEMVLALAKRLGQSHFRLFNLARDLIACRHSFSDGARSRQILSSWSKYPLKK